MFGERFPSMKNAYSERLIELARNVASLKGFEDEFDKKAMKMAQNDSELKIDLKEGVYAFMPGPQYETKAEINMLRLCGADAVGMSTVPEAIIACHSGIKTVAVSCITNMAAGILEQKLSYQEVKDTADKVKIKFKQIIKEFIHEL